MPLHDPDLDDDHDTRNEPANDDDAEPAIASSSAKFGQSVPAYFFPALAQQRRTFCIDVLKREDIPSVCELGCGEGSVIQPMTNGATHKDSFPEVYIDEADLHARLHVGIESSPQPESEESPEPEEEHGDESPEERTRRKLSKFTNMEILDKFKQLPTLRPEDKELHLRRIAGLDIQEEALGYAIEATAPLPPSEFSDYDRQRWEDLRVEIWQGSLEVYNDALDNFDAFVLTEVIEHLNEKSFAKFPEILFGNYRPRLIVITTPNYDFNQYFQRSGKGKNVDEEEKHAFKDPTGRTDRVFRDDDHKFEFTQEEFEDWTRSITFKYDYSVEITGVGSLRNYYGGGGFHTAVSEQDASESKSATPKLVPAHIQEMLRTCPGGDPSKFFATQCAIFRRKYFHESERSPRSPVQVPLAFYKSPQSKTIPLARVKEHGKGKVSTDHSVSPGQHRLLKTHFHPAAKEAGHPKSLSEIRNVLDNLMRDRMQAASVSLRELWGRNEVARACGGSINKIIEAIIQDPSKSWDLDYKPEVLIRGYQIEDAVFIVLKDFIPPEFEWEDPEDTYARTKEQKPKWYERDLELEAEIKGMRVDDEEGGKQPEEDEWHASEGSKSEPEQDETYKEWSDSEPSSFKDESLKNRFETIPDHSAWE